jgi:dCTP deaminase
VILTGPAIRKAVARGDIEIDPYDEKNVNPASYDLTLGDQVVELWQPPYAFDVKERWPEGDMVTRRISANGFVIRPGRGYLMHTVERVATHRYVPVLDGKSSLGRLFVSVHQTAGYGDPGFNGQYTLEVTTLYSIVPYAGMRIAQIRFHEVSGEIEWYGGNYAGEAARGPAPSKVHKQFKKGDER